MRYQKAQTHFPLLLFRRVLLPFLILKNSQIHPKISQITLTFINVFSQLATIASVHQNPIMRGWETKYYIHLIISRRIFLNIGKIFQLHAKYSLLKKKPGKNTWDSFGFFLRLSDWPNHAQNISFLHFMLWLHPSINKNLDANKPSLKIN